MKKYTIAVAGSTHRTTQCTKKLFTSNLFEISWILTPIPKPIGRKQIVTPNPLDKFASDNGIITTWIDTKITTETQSEIFKLEKPDFLLVVDFGYIIPKWLLKLPKIAPLNIHPSELPRWRGSSPGQYSLLFNDQQSAITLMVMNEKLDQGPIIHQDFFKINRNWNQFDYYKHAFKIICTDLDTKIAKFAYNQNSIKNQPISSPTITAKIIKKSQAFIPWTQIKKATKGHSQDTANLSSLLIKAVKHNQSLALTIERASKAFSPWPHLWTIISTKKGEKRMKLLETTYNKTNDSLELITVQIEGKQPVLWEKIKQYYS